MGGGMIGSILQSYNFKLTTHEPYIYTGTVYGKKISSLRQVNNFAVYVSSTDILNKSFQVIRGKLKELLNIWDNLFCIMD